jgi:hydroxymethylpyrimidine pyrophosphatase-like HAD family hydrolase
MLACDYDNTIASDGSVPPSTERALKEAKNAGLLLGLVTGRILEDLQQVCSQLELFDLIVAENGAVIRIPASNGLIDLGNPPQNDFLHELERRGICFSVGRVLVETLRTHELEVSALIEAMHLELQVVVNKDDAMILPKGVDKASGLRFALSRLDITPDRLIGIGDAENDASFLQYLGFKVAVANALDSIKANADLVTKRPNGDGVAEFICEHLLADNGLLQAADRR